MDAVNGVCDDALDDRVWVDELIILSGNKSFGSSRL